MRWVTALWAPSPSATIVITALTPMMMPSMVSAARILLASTESKATPMPSRRSMRIWLHKFLSWPVNRFACWPVNCLTSQRANRQTLLPIPTAWTLSTTAATAAKTAKAAHAAHAIHHSLALCRGATAAENQHAIAFLHAAHDFGKIKIAHADLHAARHKTFVIIFDQHESTCALAVAHSIGEHAAIGAAWSAASEL